MGTIETIRAMLQGLIVTDLKEWAGTKIYNRGRDYLDAVDELSCLEDGTLVARGIWKKIVNGLIAEVKPRAYEEAAKYLKLMCLVYTKGGRLAEWQALLVGLRAQHKAKRRLMEVLDGLAKTQKQEKLI